MTDDDTPTAADAGFGSTAPRDASRGSAPSSGTTPVWDRVALIGVGLIGGSIGAGLRSRGLARTVVGIGRDADRLRRAARDGVIDEFATDLEAGVSGAEVAVVCTPVSRVVEDVRRVARTLPAESLVTDVGSTKGSIVLGIESDAEALRRFVGAHPLAGSEKRGSEHADPDLFEGRVCVLTPTPRTPAEPLRRARGFWSRLGCRLVEIDPNCHDRALAFTSHLPHVTASVLAGLVPGEDLPLAAGAYRDATRVAMADAELWSAIFLENRQALLNAIDAFVRRMSDFRTALDHADRDALEALWNEARELRSRFRFAPDPIRREE